MYPNDAYCEFYPRAIVTKVLDEHPNATVERKNQLMQAEWDRVKPAPASFAEVLDFIFGTQ
jgi:hypothetical protein